MFDINTHIFDTNLVDTGLREYLTNRVWYDNQLLEGFDASEIDKIVDYVATHYADEINSFVGLLLERATDFAVPNWRNK